MLMPKMDSLTRFLKKIVYNDVLCLNGSKITALSVFQILNVITPLNGDPTWKMSRETG